MIRSGSTEFRGFALPAAIFLLVILTALGAFILNISTSQQLGLALDIRGERAWQAANAGMDWARYRLASNPAACPAGTAWGGSAYSVDLSLSTTSTLTGYYATVECRLLETTDVQNISTSVFEVRVTACNPAAAVEPRCPGTPTAASYAERQLQGLISF